MFSMDVIFLSISNPPLDEYKSMEPRGMKVSCVFLTELYPHVYLGKLVYIWVA
jgi:hypothetical protein